MYRILVCDGEKDIVSHLTACLTADGYQVVTARTGWEVLNILSKQHIHLALLGTKLPGLDGLTTVTRLRQMHDLPVFLLTSAADSEENVLGLTVGADDYITKPFQQAELLVRIRCHLRRSLHLASPSPETLTVGGITLDDDARAVTVNDEPVSLTPLEYDILKFLMQGILSAGDLSPGLAGASRRRKLRGSPYPPHPGEDRGRPQQSPLCDGGLGQGV